jgi:hypothetical protein
LISGVRPDGLDLLHWHSSQAAGQHDDDKWGGMDGMTERDRRRPWIEIEQPDERPQRDR